MDHEDQIGSKMLDSRTEFWIVPERVRKLLLTMNIRGED
jgi:hypothetical protein